VKEKAKNYSTEYTYRQLTVIPIQARDMKHVETEQFLFFCRKYLFFDGRIVFSRGARIVRSNVMSASAFMDLLTW
jgi:hypothetical protein